MTGITELDRRTIERIAAGEVVERPASVVTELVENSLDAGASRVEIDVAGAGLDLIRVADDGHGMAEADALLALERHTTSKIRAADDVDRVETLGFRGEALPSIDRMSDLELTTKTEGTPGVRIAGERGDRTVERAGRAPGTTVEVRALFGSTPARRRSLASPKREFARISDVVTRYALVRPDVRFELTHDGREVLSTPGTGYTDALLGVYGRRIAGRSTEFEGGDEDGVSVEGILVYPSTTRARPNHIHTGVNGRALAEGTIRRAVGAGYGSLLPGGRHPIAAVNVSLPPEEVDVNVHPAKESVSFHDERTVRNAVERAVSRALSTEDLTRSAGMAFDLDSSLRPVEGESRFDSLSVVGQFRELYLLCESGDDLLVVDQHAAHERINYERLRETVGEVERAVLDPPETLSLAPAEASAVESYREELAALGFEVAPFGGGTYRLRTVPAPLGRRLDSGALRDVLDVLRAGEDPDDIREELLADLACHPSLKAGDALGRADAERLLSRLGSCEQPFACPHGRPTVLSIEEATLARGFERRDGRR